MVYKESKTKSKNRKKITSSAIKLFIKNGFEKTTIKDILHQAEMERQTFYNYFSDKDDLINHLYEHCLRVFYSEGFSDDNYQNCDSGYEKIVKYFQVNFRRYFDNIEENMFLVRYNYYYQKGPNPDIIDEIYSSNNIKDPEDYYIEGIEDGSIRDIGGNPVQDFYDFLQMLGSYASRLLYRGYYSDSITMDKQKMKLEKLAGYLTRVIQPEK